MLFKKSKRASSASETTAAQSPRTQTQRTTAQTAHLIGPGCVKLIGRMPVWQPVEGAKLQLHPQYLSRVLCYGNVDFSTAVLRLFWRRGVQVVFLSPSGRALLGKLQPAGGAPNLQRLQHLALDNEAFRLAMAKELVQAKIDSQLRTARYYQQQGKRKSAGQTISSLKRQLGKCGGATSLASLLGTEGSATAVWYRYLVSLVPAEWGFRKRASRPATDPVNALLSLGYTLAHHRCETLLAAADFDPRIGFLHDIRAGRASLACDLVEPLRAPLVDRMVVGMLHRNAIKRASFVRLGKAFRLRPEEFKRYLAAFEQSMSARKSACSFQEQTDQRIEEWTQHIRRFHASGGGGPGESQCP